MTYSPPTYNKTIIIHSQSTSYIHSGIYFVIFVLLYTGQKQRPQPRGATSDEIMDKDNYLTRTLNVLFTILTR